MIEIVVQRGILFIYVGYTMYTIHEWYNGYPIYTKTKNIGINYTTLQLGRDLWDSQGIKQKIGS